MPDAAGRCEVVLATVVAFDIVVPITLSFRVDARLIVPSRAAEARPEIVLLVISVMKAAIAESGFEMVYPYSGGVLYIRGRKYACHPQLMLSADAEDPDPAAPGLVLIPLRPPTVSVLFSPISPRPNAFTPVSSRFDSGIAGIDQKHRPSDQWQLLAKRMTSKKEQYMQGRLTMYVRMRRVVRWIGLSERGRGRMRRGM